MILRPNYAQDAPPTSLEVGGFCYPVDVDYRTWIAITAALEDWVDDAREEEDVQRNCGILCRVQQLAFGGILADEDAGEVLSAILRFAQGYPCASNAANDSAPLLDLAADLADIIIAVRNQTGIDLSYRRTQPFHWWEFLLEVRNLCGDHLILQLMRVRGYNGADPALNRLKGQCALPVRQRAGDAARLKEINRLFYNS